MFYLSNSMNIEGIWKSCVHSTIQLSEYLKKKYLWRTIPIREKHSTEVMDQIISALDQKHLRLSIFVDHSESFSMFNHKIFLKNYIMVQCYTGFPFIL